MKLSLLAFLGGAFLFGCTPASTDTGKSDDDDDTDDTTDTTDTTDTSDTSGGGGGGADTGIAAVFYSGSVTAPGGTFESASFGNMFYGVAAGEVVCDFRGSLPLQNATASTALFFFSEDLAAAAANSAARFSFSLGPFTSGTSPSAPSTTPSGPSFS